VRAVATRMLNGHCDFDLGPNLAPAMRVASFMDAERGKSYCVLLEVGDADGDGRVDRGWGTFIVDARASREVSHQAPHPLSDANTEIQAVELFAETDARSFLLCGAHRKANAARACDDSFQEADCAHDTGTPFFAISRAIAAFYGEREHTQIQWHGMGASSCEGVVAHVSEGLESGLVSGSGAVELIGDAMIENETWNVTIAGVGDCDLNATSNVEGRALNGVEDVNACTAEASAASGAFVHVEQKAEARDAALWLEPVRRAFPIPAPTPPTSLDASATGKRITVSWTASNGASRYLVERSTASTGPYERLATTSATEWIDADVKKGKRYYYTVSAENVLGTSAPSDVVSARAR